MDFTSEMLASYQQLNADESWEPGELWEANALKAFCKAFKKHQQWISFGTYVVMFVELCSRKYFLPLLACKNIEAEVGFK